MKICFIGVFSGDLDEGYKNIAFNLSQRLSKKHDVLNMDVSAIFSLDSWKQIKEFKPHVVHYLTAPTVGSLIILKILSIYIHGIKTVASSLHPHSLDILRNSVLKRMVHMIKPNLILIQCNKVKEILEGMGCDTAFLPNGVDTERFVPASKERKEKLREKYGVEKEKFVVLHVGHIRSTRGIKLFERIQKEDDSNQVIVVGSSYFKTDEKLYQDLTGSGCLVWRQYFENIEEVYALADCYVFPTPRGESIFMPLSVLEAMSCNITALSTRYEGLIDNFEEGAGLIFIEGAEEFIDALKIIKSTDMEIETRNKVLSYTWDNIAMRLEGIYEELKS